MRPERFDAVITDEVMPGLTGTELAAPLRRRRRDLPIVLVSGYIGPMMSERALAAGVDAILKKPVQSRELAAALARVLKRSLKLSRTNYCCNKKRTARKCARYACIARWPACATKLKTKSPTKRAAADPYGDVALGVECAWPQNIPVSQAMPAELSS